MTTAYDARPDRGAAAADATSHTASSWRALRYRRDDERASIAAAIDDALRRWRADWGLARADDAREQPGATCVDANEWKRGYDSQSASTSWRRAGAVGEGAALWWAIVPPSSPGRLASPRTMLLMQLFGAHGGIASTSARDARPGRSIAEELADLALADCARALAAVFGLTCDAITDETPSAAKTAPAACFGAWSGALVSSTPWCGGELHILIDDVCASRLLNRRQTSAASRAVMNRSALTPVLRALDSKPIRLDVALTAFELELGMLSALRAGDVVRTTHRLDAPLIASTKGGDVVAEAYLGRCGQVRAAELQSISRAPEHVNSTRSR